MSPTQLRNELETLKTLDFSKIEDQPKRSEKACLK